MTCCYCLRYLVARLWHSAIRWLEAGRAVGAALGGGEGAGDLLFVQPGVPGRFGEVAEVGVPGVVGAVGGPERAVVAVAFGQPSHPSG